MMMVGVRTTVSTRLTTMGKEAAQQQMEAIRARTFYVPFSTDANVGTTADVDILDRYFPDMGTSHVTDSWGWQGWYTAGSGDAYYTVVSPPDNNTIVLTVETRFVDYAGNVITPRVSYNSNVSGFDAPASDLLSIKVTASWLSRGQEESFTIESLVSRTDQAAQGGSSDGGGDSGCTNSSQSSINVTGATSSSYTGTADPYTSLVAGTLGSAGGTGKYDCTSTVSANSTGGQLAINGGSTYTGASSTANGPPADNSSSGPLTVGPTATWPKLYMDYSSSRATVSSNDSQQELSVAAYSELYSSYFQLQQVDGGLSGNVNNYKRWDFLNPVVSVQNSDVRAADASIVQANGVSTATGKVVYNQINFLPIQAYTASTPSALQGLVIIRNFQATAISQASGANGAASNSVNYSATIGIFNNSRAETCSGDACYDFYSISPANPLQTAVNLDNPNYALQKALFTEWYSSTTADINNSAYAGNGGSKAMVSIDALLKISSKYAVEVRQKTNGLLGVEIITQKGLQKLWLGTFDISVVQNA